MFQQWLMDQAVAGNHLAFHQVERIVVQLAHLPSGFFDDQHPGRHVPGTKFQFPESIQPSPGDMTEIQCGRTSPAHSLGAVGEKLKMFDVTGPELVEGIGETGGQQGLSEIHGFLNLQGFPITKSPAARGGGVSLFAGDVTHHPDLREVFPIERN